MGKYCVFQSFAKQELVNLEKNAGIRSKKIRKLFLMPKMTARFSPKGKSNRRIIIRNGHLIKIRALKKKPKKKIDPLKLEYIITKQ